MKKYLALVMLAVWMLAGIPAAYAQAASGNTRPRLGILPFTGGTGGDGETIATLLSFQSDIQDAFTVVPRTSAVNAIIAEQRFQMAGYTDSDTVAQIGRMLNADFVVSGHIRRLGASNLIIATIINVETFEQLAGDYREYRSIEEVRALLPDITQRLIAATRRDTSGLPRLAVAPFNIASAGVNVQEAETLAQILAVEITNTGAFAVLPRTATMQSAMQELDYQMRGFTAEEGAAALGRAINAEYVLSGEARSLGAMHMFAAQILHVQDGSLLAGDVRDYQVIDDGIVLMAELARLLTDRSDAARWIARRQRERARAALFGDPARLWSVGLSAGTSFADPWLIATLRGTVAPLQNWFLEMGFDFGFVSDIPGVGYYSMYPFIHAAHFRPFAESGGWYAGAGVGFMRAEYRFDDLILPERIMAVNLIAGVNIANMLDISYTLRTNFISASNKISVGYTYRFK